MDRLTHRLDRLLAVTATALFAVLVLVVTWQVFSRQVLQNPATWTEETARYLFVWLGLFASALVFSERGHIAVDVLVRKATPASQKLVGMLVQTSILMFAVLVLIYGGSRAAANAWTQTLSSLPTTVGVMYLAMPITGAITAFYAVRHLVAIARDAEAPVETTDIPEGA